MRTFQTTIMLGASMQWHEARQSFRKRTSTEQGHQSPCVSASSTFARTSVSISASFSSLSRITCSQEGINATNCWSRNTEPSSPYLLRHDAGALPKAALLQQRDNREKM